MEKVRTVAAIYDIHGNLPALEAVLAEIERFSVDQILAGGDVASGPFTAALIRRRPRHRGLSNQSRSARSR